MKKVFVTREIPQVGIDMLKAKGYEVVVSKKNRPLSESELVKILKKTQYDAVLTLLTDQINKKIFDVAPSVKIFANYAIGFNNIDIEEAKRRGVFVTNTPGGGADRVAEHTWALILALTCRIVEADAYVRKGKFKGWDPMIFNGLKLAGKTLGIVGTGRIGADVAHRAAHGFGMKVAYYDIKRNEDLEKNFGAQFYATPDEVLKIADIVSIHVPLMESTKHLINKARLMMMKPTAFLINTSRGPVIDEVALVNALKTGMIAGAGLDVFEFEPKLSAGLAKLSNVVLTPHIASATSEARRDMATMSAQNIIDALEGKKPVNLVY